MYNNKFIAVVKSNGKILREQGDTIYIPFGSEYEIFMKNHHTERAVVSIRIDGKDVLDGSKIIVDSGSTSTIEGFLRGDRVSHKFKFIEKTQEISDYRGDDIDDGIIVIKWRFEKKSVDLGFHYNNLFNTYDTGIKYSGQSPTCDTRRMSNHSTDGITVNGGQSDQSFHSTSIGSLENTVHTIVFQLKGDTGQEIIEKPVYVKTKLKCPTCGKTSRSGAKFCSKCGTSLIP